MNKPEIQPKVEQQSKPRITKEELKRQIQKMKDRDSERISGIFKYLERPGGTLRFRYKMYPGDKYEEYVLVDGERYSIPRGVARHLNTNCWYLEYQNIDERTPGVKGAPYNLYGQPDKVRMQAAKKVHRCEFRNLEFMDDDIDIKNNELIQVTYKF